MQNSVLDILKYCLPTAAGLTLTLDVIILKKKPYLCENIAIVLFWCFILNALLSVVLRLMFETLILPNNWDNVMCIVIHCLS